MFTYKSALTALFFSFSLYASYLDLNVIFLNTIVALMAFTLLFTLSKKELFFVGFLTGFFWFWWVGYSFYYYDLSYLIPLVIFGVGLVYGILFVGIGLFENIVYKSLMLFALSFVNPFGFNWFKFELPFIQSYFGTSKIEFFLIIFTLAFFIQYKNIYKKQSLVSITTIFLILYGYNVYTQTDIQKPQLKIAQYNTHIDQDKKWNRIYKDKIIFDNFTAIQNAITNGYDLIILPETAFPLVLNHNANIEALLLEMSHKISIVTGSLFEKDGLHYNSTYFYEKGKVQVANKVVLVPFGEAVPLPEKIRDFINNLFYKGAKDYETADKPTTFTIQGVKFRNAICYEATTDEIYKNLDTQYVITISNNGWFTPSIQPTLQKLLMQYYKKKYNLY